MLLVILIIVFGDPLGELLARYLFQIGAILLFVGSVVVLVNFELHHEEEKKP